MENWSVIQVLFFGLVAANVVLATLTQGLKEYAEYLSKKGSVGRLSGIVKLTRALKISLVVGEMLIIPVAIVFVMYFVIV